MVYPEALSPVERRGARRPGRSGALSRRLVVALLAVLLVLLGAGPAFGEPVGVPPAGTGGALVTWGDQAPTPPDSLAGKTVTAVAGGLGHSLALTSDGAVTAWGRDQFGQTNVPASLTGKTVIAIAAGDNHSLALTSDGQVTAWGHDNSGQVDVPASLTGKRVTALAAANDHSLALTSDGQVTAWGSTGSDVPASLTGKRVMAIAAGFTFSLALTSDGQIATWGSNPEGPLTPPDSLTGKQVTAIAADGWHSLALTSDGKVTAWGDDFYGQSDVPDSLTGKTVVAIAAGFTFSLALTSDGQITAWSSNMYGENGVPPLNGKVATAIAGGFNFGLSVAANPEAAQVSVDPQDVHVQVGASATFTASASGAPVPTIQWQKRVGGTFTDIPGATGTFYTTPPAAEANDQDQYRAVFNNGLGTGTSAPASLVVDPIAPTAPTISSVAGGDGSATVTFTPGEVGFPEAAFDVTATPATGPGVTRTDVTSPTSFDALTNGVGYTFTVTAHNKAGKATSDQFGPVIPGVAAMISGTPTDTVAIGTGYSFAYTLAGKPAPTTTLASGALPDGLTLSSDGQITGTPTAPGLFTFAVTAKNAVGGHTTNSSTITVLAAPAAPTINDATGGDSSAVVAFTPGAAGYPAATTFDVTAKATDGTSVTATNVTSPATVPGLINGVAYTFTVTAKNTVGSAASAPSGPLTVGATSSISGIPTATATAGTAYSFAYTLTGLPAPDTTIATGALPEGLSLSPDGKIAGTPTTAGKFTFTVKASNAVGADTTRSATIIVTPGAPAKLTITSGNTQSAASNTPFATPLSVTVTDAENNPVPHASVTFAVASGSATLGGTNPVTTTATGTASTRLTAGAGSDPLTITATIGTGPTAVTATFTALQVLPAPLVIHPDAPNLPDATVGQEYRQTITATGGQGHGYAFTLTPGSTLPPGLTLRTGGLITGTPTSPGDTTFTIDVNDPTFKTYRIHVAAAAPTSTSTSTSTSTFPPFTPTGVTHPNHPNLPNTGAPITGLAAIGVAALLAGLALSGLAITRRRGTQH